MIFVLLASVATQAPSSADTSLVVALISLAATLAAGIFGIIQILLARDRRKSKAAVEQAKDKNVEQKFTEVDSRGEWVLQRLAEVERENSTLRERLATLEGRTEQQTGELRNRNEKIDQLTREIAVWEYRWSQIPEDSGQSGSSGS